MTSPTKRKHTETFNTTELCDFCDDIDDDNREESFDSVRQWLNTNKDDVNTLKAAIMNRNECNWTPLHQIICKQPPLDIIQAIIKYEPGVLKMKNHDGQLPIHHACQFGASLEVIKTLLTASPDSIKAEDNDGWLPLHYAIYCDSSLDIFNLLIESYPKGKDHKNNRGRTPVNLLKTEKFAEEIDNNGMFPLHHACKKKYSDHLICLLIQASSVITKIKDNHGRTPLDYYTSFQGRQSCNEIISLLQPASMKKKKRLVVPAPASQEADYNLSQVLPIVGNEVLPQIAEIENKAVQQTENDGKMGFTQIKSNINKLESGMVELKSEMKGELNAFKASVQSDMTEINSESKVELNALKASVQSDMTQISSELAELKSEMKLELNALKASVQSDMTKISSEMVKLKSEMNVELNAFKASIQSDMTEMKSEMKVELNAFKDSVQSDMTEIKSMLCQFGAI